MLTAQTEEPTRMSRSMLAPLPLRLSAAGSDRPVGRSTSPGRPSALEAAKSSGCRLHGRFAHALGLLGQRAHLLLEKLGLQPERVLHVLCLDELVAEVERRVDVALHEVAVLPCLTGNRQRRGLQALFEQCKIFVVGLSKPRKRLSQPRPD